MNNIIDFIKQNGSPFETLELDMTADKKEIKSQYKELARKYHPDKNLNTKEKFIKIQKAYEFLIHNLADIHKYVEHQKFRQQEQKKMTSEQKQYAEDLKRREQMAERQKQQEDIVKQMRVNEEMNRLEEQRKFEENEKKQKQEKLIQFELQNQDLYKRLNTIKIKWAKDQLYTPDLLSLLFKNYGAIQEIKVQDNKRKATITFHTTEAANNAVIQQSDGFLKVKHFMKKEKRQQVQKQLQTEKEMINRNDQDVYQLSTDTLNRISHFYNKDSKIKEGLDELKREQERLKLINQIYEEELNK
ncbi:unnamed protein product (macronuclear) [Paramecium tetraurelia]|uniref:J domain-containing protein n=1 Tax=Paramecium tetraurelia TaxID=5888 RepID=A0BZ28_PARTE|nr:uncharacterized protein GSPATT00033648001 [Paramecium tetraurelia]CAK63795.1 unnamed protein product [Paramecium tetraurelia]|eukprot:XP_001431193.1 hypothetical protein (macronuclear) [Paramecium tetraurelia strain d4-2]